MENKDNKKVINILKYLKLIASVKLTVICLLFLVVLVIWGTVYQADYGLYQAQQKFFYSWVFLVFGFIPIPGTVLVIFVLTLNLIGSIFFRIGFKLSNIGNFITHLGLIILFLGGGLTFFFSVESSLMMMEHETKNRSTSRDIWEVAVWEQTKNKKTVYAFDTIGLKKDTNINFTDIGINLSVINSYSNCSPVFKKTGDGMIYSNSSGIGSLNIVAPMLEGSDNIAGIILDVKSIDALNKKVLLFGKDKNQTRLSINGKKINFLLRKKQFILPLFLELKDFTIKYYPNSQIVKSYESMVTIKDKLGVLRDVKISMNKPLRYEDLTFFQSSYYIASDGTEYSIFSVVKNSGRLLPYVSSLFIFLGLIIHFIMMFYKRRKKRMGER